MDQFGIGSDYFNESDTSSIDDRDREKAMAKFASSKIRAAVDGGPL
jgi:hypothetical protein